MNWIWLLVALALALIIGIVAMSMKKSSAPTTCVPDCSKCGVADGCGGQCPPCTMCACPKCVTIENQGNFCDGTCPIKNTCSSSATCSNKGECIAQVQTCTPVCSICNVGADDKCGGKCPDVLNPETGQSLRRMCNTDAGFSCDTTTGNCV